MHNNDINDNKIVIEIRELVNDIDNFKEDVEEYCRFMKEMFLSTSGKN
ncbi:MAG: hypothetical protein PHV37_08090 [Candidatus Gastranaerophilales bacterium]|nr:hypothetical protein [Candidatus Gastranaerophilales bacterium]